MSKQPSNTTKQRLLRRGLAGILSLALILGLLPSTLFTSAGAASWATPYVNTLVDWGVMRGDIGGNMAPDRSITRAEFVAMMNRAYGYSKLGGHPFTDVRVRDWYNEDIDIGYNIGYFKGTGPTTASPNDTLTREQAAVLLARNMMLQETVGETLGFSDSRTLSDWSRGLVGAAASHGIISGYDDGTFKPFNNITRGEVAAMLVRAIGTPIQTAGDHALGNVYGNVTVNTSGVKLRDGVIVGNLYLTGGIDLGDVLLENITVLGEIVVSGGGESNSSQSSIIMRNVTADSMVVDSIGSQFVTIRAEGDTDIPTTTVRTNAYVDDSALPGYGLSHIVLDGEDGALYQLAGNIKEVINKTPGSDMQFVQGTANKVTVDEEAKDSSVLIDGDAVVDELDLDTATTVTGTGDIGQLNVGAAGSTVEQLPDKIEIRPGITTEINGSEMNSTQAAESSSEPKLLAGYPAVRKIAPTKAELVFKTNKTGTIYWAVSAVADGSVSEDDLLEPPAYGNKIVASGNVAANAANKEFTAAVTGLTTGGSYYVTAMLVDGRNQRSPIKVTSFTTPDDTVPAFAQGYPVMSKVTCDEAQVTVMTTKSCLLYYALLPKGAAAPKPEEFKSAAIPGNLGYGSLSVTKNVTMPFPVNDTLLDEKTDYVLYLWLTDHDGAKSSSVVSLPFTTPDETPPIVTDMMQTSCTTNSITMTYAINEPANLVWAVVTEGSHMAGQFLAWDEEEPLPGNEDITILKFNEDSDLLEAKVRLLSGVGALQSSATTNRSPFNINNLDPAKNKTSSYVLYYMANDNATASGNLSTQIKAIRVHTEDNVRPTASLSFENPDGTVTTPDSAEATEKPQSDADIHIIFSENVKGSTKKNVDVFLDLYNDMVKKENDAFGKDPDSEEVSDALIARNTLAETLEKYIKLYKGVSPSRNNEVKPLESTQNPGGDGLPSSWIDWRNAVVQMMDDGSGRVEIVLKSYRDVAEYPGEAIENDKSAVKLESGTSYYFRLTGIYDMAVTPNELDPAPCELPFSTRFAKVLLEEGDTMTIGGGTGLKDDVTDGTGTVINSARRIDFDFTARPQDMANMAGNESVFYDMLIWANTSMKITLYSREIGGSDTSWMYECELDIPVYESQGFNYLSVAKFKNGAATADDPKYELLKNFAAKEYAIHVDELGTDGKDFRSWNKTASVRVSVVAGTQRQLISASNGSTQADYETALGLGVISVGTPDPFILSKLFTDSRAPSIDNKPTLKNLHDTSAEIEVPLNAPGSVYYMVIPLSALKMNGNELTGELFEQDVRQVGTDYSSPFLVYHEGTTKPDLGEVPLMSGDPDENVKPAINYPYTVVSPSREYFLTERDLPNVIKGATKEVPGYSSASINLNGKLKANTVYLVCLMTRGVSAIYSDTVQCYRFTTNMPERPSLKLEGNTATSVDAIVDRTAKVRSVLLNRVGIATDEKYKFLNEKFFTDERNNFVQYELIGDFNYESATIKGYTVLEALYNNYGAGSAGTNALLPSVFDKYADADTKNKVQQLIETTGAEGLVKAYWGTEPIPVEGNATEGRKTMSFTSNELQAGIQYVCLAYAMGDSADSTAYRATYPVAIKDDDPPTLDNVLLGLSVTNNKISGGITLVFNKDIYNRQRYPFTQKSDGKLYEDADNVKYIGMDGTISSPYPTLIKIGDNSAIAPTSTIVLKVEDLMIAPFSISVQNVCSSWGNPVRPSYSVDISCETTTDTNGTVTGYTFHYTIMHGTEVIKKV